MRLEIILPHNSQNYVNDDPKKLHLKKSVECGIGMANLTADISSFLHHFHIKPIY